MEPVRVISQPTAAAASRAPLCALVIAADARYRERAQSVLGEVAEVSCAMTTPVDAGDVQWLVREARADVVVLDATGCEAAVGRLVAELAVSAPRLGVVVVCEHLTQAAHELGALPKWGWTRDLRVAVQRAQIDGSPLASSRRRLHAERRDLRGVGPGDSARRQGSRP